MDAAKSIGLTWPELGDDELRIRVEPEPDTPGAAGRASARISLATDMADALSLHVHFGATYPDEPPDLTLDALEGDFDDAELASLRTQLDAEVEANLVCRWTTALG